jgi:3'-phosphoadenosine 5'-phosphosulfate sulfotransferase (PAPS reductase)/FAD synthetase
MTDPLNPTLDAPTPVNLVASLTAPQRLQRLARLQEQALTILDDAAAVHVRGRRIVARCLMVSGGNDSTVGAHLFRHWASHMLHADTGTGVPATQQFVRDTAAAWGLPLIIRRSQTTYRDLILGRVPKAYPGGFPGRGAHAIMFTRLKERAWDDMRRLDLPAHRRQEVRLFLAFRRREESRRRSQPGQVPLHEPDGTTVWVAPLANWTKLDLNTYRLAHAVPVNQVSDHLHMSGECLCGAYGTRAELGPLGDWYPDTREQIDRWERDVAREGITGPTALWGHGLRGHELAAARREWLCGSCATAGAS